MVSDENDFGDSIISRLNKRGKGLSKLNNIVVVEVFFVFHLTNAWLPDCKLGLMNTELKEKHF